MTNSYFRNESEHWRGHIILLAIKTDAYNSDSGNNSPVLNTAYVISMGNTADDNNW
jgi:hypothetical protein